MIYDAFGREIRPERRPDGRVMSVAALTDRYSSYPSKGLTPERLASIFREADGGDVYRQMDLFEEMEEKDTHLFSILQTRKLALAGLEFEVEPAAQDKKDRDIADFVSEVINGLPDFEDNLFDMLDGVGKGYSGLEIYWDVKDNKNIVRHLEWIHPRKFTWFNSMSPKVLTLEAPSMGIDLPPFKFVFHQHKTKSGYPTRQGVMRVCAWMYLFKNYDIKDWVAFAEVYGMPLRLGKYDLSATKEDKETLIQAVRSLGSDAAGIISKSTEIEFVEAIKNSGKDVYEILANFCNAEMSKAVLGQTLTTQQGGTGSYALGQVHDKVRGDILRADCSTVSKTLRRDLVRPIVGFNFGWDAALPKIKFHHEDPEDLNKESDRYKTLIDSGMEIGEEHMYEKFGIPKPRAGEKTVKARTPQPPPAGMMPNKACPACMVNKGAEPAQGDQVDAMVERLMNEAGFDALLEPVARLVATSGSLEDLRDGILDLYRGMDEADLGNLMQRAFAAAELLGRYNAGKGGA